MIEKNRLLFISYHFPPTGGGGVQRSLKFVKYLPSFGWEPIVLTVSNSVVKYKDETLLQDLPSDVCVHKIRRLPLIPFAERYRAKAKRDYDSAGNLVRIKSYSKIKILKPFIFIINKLFDAAKYIANNFIYIPDVHAGWLPGAVVKGILLVKKNNLKVIYATGDPWSSFLAAFLISKLTKVPYVLDFRDPWTLHPHFISPGVIYTWLCCWLEKLCIHHADKVIFTCNRAMRAYKARYKSEPPEKFLTITHGYEPEDFERISIRSSQMFTISYVGTVYSQYYQSIEAFFKAISNILKTNREMCKKLQINFLGIPSSFLDRYLRKNRISNIVRLVGYVDFKESIQYMENSKVLLLFGGMSGLQVAGKVFEYLAARRPILALASLESDVAFLVRDNNAGIVVEPDDVAGVEKAILYFYKSPSSVSYSSSIKKYTRKELASRLASELNSIVS